MTGLPVSLSEALLTTAFIEVIPVKKTSWLLIGLTALVLELSGCVYYGHPHYHGYRHDYRYGNHYRADGRDYRYYNDGHHHRRHDHDD
jgi:hypothetical protein